MRNLKGKIEISILVAESIKVNLIFLINTLEILLFLKERKKDILRIAIKVSFYRSMNCHYGIHSAIRSFLRILPGSIDLRKTEVTCRAQNKIIRNRLSARFSPHPQTFLYKNGVGQVAARPASFPIDEDSTSGSRSNQKRNHRAMFRLSQSLDMLANVPKISIFLREYNPSSVIVFKSLFLSCDVKLGGNEVITLRYKQIGQNRR